MYLVEILIGIGSFCVGALFVYLTAYSKEKGRSKALLEDITQLENEKQKIQTKFQAEMEELKKQHALDVKKREFKYADKREQFAKYFALLEEFHSKSNSLILERFQSVTGDFLVAFMSGEQDVKNKAIKIFNDTIHVLFTEINRDLLKLRSETHGLRLIASDELDVLLNELDQAISKSNDDAMSMAQFIAKPEFWANQSLLKPYEEQNLKSAVVVSQIHEKVKSQMKKDLDII